MQKLNIKVIIGSTREGRFSEKPARWIFDELKKNEGIEPELLDLRDYPMPFFDQPMSPAYAKEPFANGVVKKWKAKIAEADGFVVVTPEYNHGYSAVLKNAFDWVYYEWNKKPIGFVSYGGVGGARAIEQLRQVAVELQMAPLRAAIHLPWDIYLSMMSLQAPVDPALFAPVAHSVAPFIEQLTWWGIALKNARTA